MRVAIATATLVIIAAAAACLVASVSAFDHDCDYDAAAAGCDPLLGNNTGAALCPYFKCLAQRCPIETTHDIADLVCHGKPLKKESSKTMNASSSSLRPPASPCGYDTSNWSMAKAQSMLVAMGLILQRKHADEHYSENMVERWVGIHDHICVLDKGHPVPKTSDCSSFVTFMYWNLFGKGDDFLNGEHWDAGYTGTLVKHGVPVPIADAKAGALVFYYTPMHHVAMVIAPGKVVSHGYDPVSILPIHYAPADYARSYLHAGAGPAPSPPSPSDSGCKVFYNDLCPGDSLCRCTKHEKCGSSLLNATRARSASGGCAGECKKVELDRCRGNDSCLHDTGMKC